MQGKRIVVFVAVAVAVVLAAWAFWPGEERLIRSRLENLAAAASESGGQGIGQMAHAAELASFFSADAVVDLGSPHPEIRGRDAIMALAAQATAPDDEFTITFKDITVTLDPGEKGAAARLTAVVSGRGPGLLGDTVDASEIEIDLSKADGEWTVSRVTIVQPIARPQ